MKGWYGNKMAHSLASRGIRSRSEIQAEMDRIKQRESELNEEMRLYKIIENVKDKYLEYIDDEAYGNMEEFELTQEELNEILADMDNDEFLDVFFGGDMRYFLENFTGIVDEFQRNYSIDDSGDADNKIIEEFREDNGEENDRSNEDYVLNLSTGLMTDLLLEMIKYHGDYIIEGEISDAKWDYSDLKELSEKESDDLIRIAIDKGIRKETDERFQPSVDKKKSLLYKAYEEEIKYEELTDNEKDFVADAIFEFGQKEAW